MKEFFDRVKAILAVMVPLLLALIAYLKATGANDDAVHDEKIRQLMFSALPTKDMVQAHWAAQDVAEADIKRRLEALERFEREHDISISRLEGHPCH